MRYCRVVAVLALVGFVPRPASAQDAIQRIRDLYSAAAYEDVISAVSAADSGGTRPEVEQYRVFSLLALGNAAGAEKTAEQVLTASPRFHPDDDASPRIVALFQTVRRRIVPDIAAGMFTKAKDAFDRGDHEAAIAGFQELVAVADDADLKDDKTVGQLKVLASGFLDLSRARRSTAAPPAANAVPAAAASSAASTPEETAPKRLTITLPTPITETLPPWHPEDAIARREFRGAIRLQIDATGHVINAQMVQPVHPVYDAALLRASRTWVYHPGTSNGTPVPSERVLDVVLKPR